MGCVGGGGSGGGDDNSCGVAAETVRICVSRLRCRSYQYVTIPQGNHVLYKITYMHFRCV